MSTTRRGFLAVAAVGGLAACTTPDGGSEASLPSSPTTEPTTTTPSPAPALAWGPTQDDLDAAIETAAELSPEQVAGQVLVARYGGTDPSVPAALVTQLGVAGVILFAENVASLDQVRESAAAVQEAAEADRTWPAIVSVDNEGGRVQRLSGATGPWTSFPAFAAAGAAVAAGEVAVVTDAMAAMARELRACGVNVDWAPVADVTIGAADVTIADRSSGSDPAIAAAAVVAAVEGFADGAVLASAKHFPGHGTLNVDSHQNLPVQDMSTAELEARDLVPFRAAVDAGVPMVMIGHIAVTDWDEGVPASLSAAAYDYLRSELGFTGIAVTDGLDMGALTRSWDSAQIAVKALQAGADLLLSPADTEAAHAGIVAALADGSLERGRIDEAAGRVIAMMRWSASMVEQAGDPGEPGDAAEAASALASFA